ncbi:hypothetical protein K2X05_08335 [bacterium]|nr:hypothetical protein [bacterium]
MKRVSLFFLVILVSNMSFAVDGYQDIKFGIKYEQLKKMKKCDLNLDTSESTKYIKVYNCSNFKFGEKTVDGYFYFIDEKLRRVGFLVGDSNEDFLSFIDILTKKYGGASRKPAAIEIQTFDAGTSDSVDFAWDKNTIILRQYRENNQTYTLLLYSSSIFDSEMIKSKTKGVTDAI